MRTGILCLQANYENNSRNGPYWSTLVAQPDGAGRYCQKKWQLLKTIEDIREPLGLKGTSISLLRAMISYLRVDQVDAMRDDGHICFASNASLAKRAYVSIQTIERHIAKLVSLGLLTRRSSGNSKRWARRDSQGSIVFATGLSLLPLVERYPEFVRMAQDHQDIRDEQGRLRDMCSAALSNLKAHWSCRVYVPVSQFIWAAFRSKAKGLLPPNDECPHRGL